MLTTLVVKENKFNQMAKAKKKKAAPAKKVAVKKTIKKKEVTKAKPTELKAGKSHVEIPYIPRRIVQLPPDLNKLKK